MSSTQDPFRLQRFVDAQNPVYAQVRAELGRGMKTSHWMWFIFPQIAGLGYSAMARQFAISSLAEAQAYWNHPVLGPRLEECTRLILAVENPSIGQILGSPDDMKFRSCLTLFARAASSSEVFEKALQKYFAGQPDQLTLDRL